jgi:predicted thioesterase
MSELVKGMTGTAEVEVTDSNTAAALGNEGVDVFATPFMVALMEEACRNVVEPHLEDGTITLGGHVDLKHLAPTPRGYRITARATLVEVKGSRLAFEVEITDRIEPVGRGRHTRFLAPEEAFQRKVAEKAEQSP